MTSLERAAYQPIAELIPYLGYGEKDSNYDLKNMNTFGHNNYTFIAQYFDDLWNSGYKFYNTRKNGPSGEWCDMTVDFSMCMAFGNENARKVLYQPMESCGAGCAWSASYYRENNAWTTTPKTGDQIFFGTRGNESHTGIVEKVEGGYVHTIEGNTSDRLLRRKYSLNDSKIAGYGRPNYKLVTYLFEEEDMTREETQQMISKAMEEIIFPQPTKSQILTALKDKWINTYADLPDWAKPEVMELIQIGALKGKKPANTPEETVIDGSLEFFIRPAIVAYRMAKKLAENAPKEALAKELEKMLEALRNVE